MPAPGARERVLVGLLLLGLLLALFWESALGGRVLGGTDALFATPFFAAQAPPGFHGPRNPLLFDAVYQFIPWRHFACESLRHGELPLWNPLSACGTPLVATMQAAVFYPLNLLLCAVPFAPSLVWGAILRLWVAGFSTYLLGRLYGLAAAAALVAGVAFMLCGFLVVWLEHPHVNVAVWLPAMVLLDERVLGAPTARARGGALALLAFVLGLQLTGGHIETSVDALFLLALYHAVRWYQLRAQRGFSSLALPLLALILGAGLAGPQLLPFLEWLPLSAELQQRQAAALPLVDLGFWRNLLALPLAVFPNLYNNPTWGSPYYSFLPWGNYHETILYVGTVPILLAAVALVALRLEPVVRCWALVGVVSLGMALRLPGLDWLNRLPGLRLAYPGRLRLLTALSLCLLAGFGASAIDGTERVFRRLGIAVVAAGVLLAVLGTAVLPVFRDHLVARGRAIAERKYAALAHPSRPLAYYHAEVEQLAEAFLRAYRADNLRMYAPVLWALAGLSVLRFVPRRRRVAALAVLAAADLGAFAYGYHPALPAEEFYPETPITRRLAADRGLHRVTALGEDLVPDAHMMYGLADVRGLDFRTAWYDAYLGLVPERMPWIGYGVLLGSAASPFLRVLNLEYVVSARPAELGDGMEVVAEGGITLGALRQVQPRSFMLYEAVAAASDGEALALLRAAPEAVFSRVILAGPAPPLVRHAPPPTHDVTLLDYRAHEASFRVTTPEAGYLVTTDAYYPGWNAYLDGRPTRLWRANVAFRAVAVPAGEHVVAFRYEPRSLRLGLATAAVSALVVLGLLVAAYWT